MKIAPYLAGTETEEKGKTVPDLAGTGEKGKTVQDLAGTEEKGKTVEDLQEQRQLQQQFRQPEHANLRLCLKMRHLV